MGRVNIEILRHPINGKPPGSVISVDSTSANVLVLLGRAKYPDPAPPSYETRVMVAQPLAEEPAPKPEDDFASDLTEDTAAGQEMAPDSEAVGSDVEPKTKRRYQRRDLTAK